MQFSLCVYAIVPCACAISTALLQVTCLYCTPIDQPTPNWSIYLEHATLIHHSEWAITFLCLICTDLSYLYNWVCLCAVFWLHMQIIVVLVKLEEHLKPNFGVIEIVEVSKHWDLILENILFKIIIWKYILFSFTEHGLSILIKWDTK